MIFLSVKLVQKIRKRKYIYLHLFPKLLFSDYLRKFDCDDEHRRKLFKLWLIRTKDAFKKQVIILIFNKINAYFFMTFFLFLFYSI